MLTWEAEVEDGSPWELDDKLDSACLWRLGRGDSLLRHLGHSVLLDGVLGIYYQQEGYVHIVPHL